MIITGQVARDHGCPFVSINPQVTISRLVQRLKGKTAYKLLHKFPHLHKKCWGDTYGYVAISVVAVAM